jgi:hypothetical protein
MFMPNPPWVDNQQPPAAGCTLGAFLKFSLRFSQLSVYEGYPEML